jgi:hypothetical protein
MTCSLSFSRGGGATEHSHHRRLQEDRTLAMMLRLFAHARDNINQASDGALKERVQAHSFNISLYF